MFISNPLRRICSQSTLSFFPRSLLSSSSSSSCSSPVSLYSVSQRYFTTNPLLCFSSTKPISSASPSSAPAPSSSSFPSSSPVYRKKTAPDAERAVTNLLYNIPNSSDIHNRHVLSALVSNEPGVLSRVSGVLAGRGFNIDSLVVSETETVGVSRMTIVLRGGDGEIEQARRQIEDMVQVWAVVEYAPSTPVVERELLLVKVALTTTNNNHHLIMGKPPTLSPGSELSIAHSSALLRTALIELSRLFGGRIVDVTNEMMLIELTAKSSRLDAFIALVKPYGIIELARSGALVLTRGPMREMEGSEDDPAIAKLAVDETQLPPG